MNSTSNMVAFIESDQTKFYRIAFSYVKNREDALDVVHEAIVKALQKQYTLRQPEHMQTWFYRILINESITFLRKRRKIVALDDLNNFDIPYMEQSKQNDYIDLYEALDKLPIKLRTTVLLRFFEEMKIEEIAQVMEANLSTTKSRFYKALQLLKIDMEVKEND